VCNSLVRTGTTLTAGITAAGPAWVLTCATVRQFTVRRRLKPADWMLWWRQARWTPGDDAALRLKRRSSAELIKIALSWSGLLAEGNGLLARAPARHSRFGVARPLRSLPRGRRTGPAVRGSQSICEGYDRPRRAARVHGLLLLRLRLRLLLLLLLRLPGAPAERVCSFEESTSASRALQQLLERAVSRECNGVADDDERLARAREGHVEAAHVRHEAKAPKRRGRRQ
jgi:hypothetical protein